MGTRQSCRRRWGDVNAHQTWRQQQPWPMIKPEIVNADWRGWFNSNPTPICCTVSWLIVLGCMSVVIYDVNSEDEKENSAVNYRFVHMVVAVVSHSIYPERLWIWRKSHPQ